MFAKDRCAWHSILLVLLAAALVLPQVHAQSRGSMSAATLDAALARVRQLLAADNLQDARASLVTVLEQHPGSAEAHFLLGTISERQNDLSAATRWWTKDLDGALTALRAAVGIDPKHAEARYYLGLTLKQKGQLADAIAQLREAVRIGPRLTPARLQLGVALQELGDLDGAVEHLTAATRLDPASADAHNSLGLALMQSGAAEQAVAAFRTLVAQEPGNITARVNLGTALMQSGDLAAAVERSPRQPGCSRQAPRRDTTLASPSNSEMTSPAPRRSCVAPRSSMPVSPRRLLRSVWCCGRLAEPRKRCAHSAMQLPGGPRTPMRTTFAEAERLAPYLRAPESDKR